MAPCSSDAAPGMPPIDVQEEVTSSSSLPAMEPTGSCSKRSDPVVGFVLPPPSSSEDHSPDGIDMEIGTTKDPTDEPDQKRRRLSRLVSQDELSRGRFGGDGMDSSDPLPAFPNPLADPGLLRNHINSLRLETDLHPLRMIVARLMGNTSHNRRGIFNEPVDPIALGLPDYTSIIQRPIDLGTIKRRLYAVAYPSRQEAADDIRRVFTNAMLYNPSNNVVHKCAAELLKYFNACYNELDACVLSPSPCFSSRPANTPPNANDVNVNSGSETFTTTHSSGGLPSIAEDLSTKLPQGAGRVTNERYDGDTKSSAGKGAQQSPPKELKGNTWVEVTHVPPIPLSRRVSVSSSMSGPVHYCVDCESRTCAICKQGCLQHEPSLLVCCGQFCSGAKIRKSAIYYITPDGNLQFCERCYSSLPSAMSEGTTKGTIRYKQDLLKRRNDEEIAEQWINCQNCSTGVHAICAMHNSFLNDPAAYKCPSCNEGPKLPSESNDSVDESTRASLIEDSAYTFVSGRQEAMLLSELAAGSVDDTISSQNLPECAISVFIQQKVRNLMASVSPNAEKTVTIRVISDCDRSFDVPDVIRRYFRMQSSNSGDDDTCVRPPSSVSYRQKAIAMFQKLDGIDVCIFCMFVQEYGGQETPTPVDSVTVTDKRVYIAYIDSLSHFRPREIRTEVFHEILISYLATARERGFEKANIWSCPPSRGNCFVFWNHPASQRTPTPDRLQNWYHTALATAVRYGVVTDVRSLYETDFEKQVQDIRHQDAPTSIGSETTGKMVCPPLIDGDFWVEEVARIHSANLSKHLKVRTPTEVCVFNVKSLSNVELDRCPALQVAAVIKNRVMAHPASVPFHRPVNAAALKLKNYHSIVKKPMDLGTIYARCILGDYEYLRDVVADVELMATNAKTFNPEGHVVHKCATDVSEIFFSELNVLVQVWGRKDEPTDALTWESYESTSMSLDVEIDVDRSSTPENLHASVVVEDDFSTDASKSLSSSVAASFADSISQQVQDLEQKSQGGESSVLPSVSAPARSSASSSSRQASRRPVGRPKVEKPPEEKLDLLSGDPKAIEQLMVGEELWLLEKKGKSSLSTSSHHKKNDPKRGRRSSVGGGERSRRSQSWLCEELTETVRRMRSSFFSCSLVPKNDLTTAEKEKLSSYQAYSSAFSASKSSSSSDEFDQPSSSLAESRAAVLELCQFRHLEFDTLRRAKYSTSMLLYHLHHSNAPGSAPVCSSCSIDVTDVRWHKVQKMEDPRRVSKRKRSSSSGHLSTTITQPLVAATSLEEAKRSTKREELCTSCYRKSMCADDFIPISMSSPSTRRPVHKCNQSN